MLSSNIQNIILSIIFIEYCKLTFIHVRDIFTRFMSVVFRNLTCSEPVLKCLWFNFWINLNLDHDNQSPQISLSPVNHKINLSQIKVDFCLYIIKFCCYFLLFLLELGNKILLFRLTSFWSVFCMNEKLNACNDIIIYFMHFDS